MKVIAFNGSPRKGGNTQTLMDEALLGAKEKGAEVTLYNLNELKIRPCQNCGGCDETGGCVIQDDIQAIHRDIRAADRIILASPIFFFGVSGQAKIMIDRCQAFWMEKYVLKRPIEPGPYGRKGLLLLVGGMKRNDSNRGYECPEVTARAFFRTVSVQEHVTLSYDLVDAKGAIKQHATAMKDAYAAGIALAGS